MINSAMAMRPPNYKYAKGAYIHVVTAGSAAGTREGPVDSYLAASRPPCWGVALAINWAAMARHTSHAAALCPTATFLALPSYQMFLFCRI
jgi:hypothetical protein